jgi:CubicO group peptidase (beta-lactamase class C family)
MSSYIKAVIPMRSRIFTAFLSIVLLGASHPASADKVDDYVRKAIRAAHIPAAAVVVLRAGKPPKIAAYGTADIEGNVPATTDTAFQLASATKLFTGILVMRMVEERKLTLADPVSKYVEDMPPKLRNITIMELASHSSGLPDALTAGPFKDIDAVRGWASAQPALAQASVQSIYSQTEFALLTQVLERVSGKSFDALLEDEIIRPLGLTETHYAYLEDVTPDPGTSVVSAKLIPRRTTAYRWTGSEQLRYEYTYPQWTHANAGLFISASDIAKLLEALQGNKLLNAASKQTLTQPYILKDGKNAPFGVAWIVRRWRNQLAIGHSGGPGYSDIWIYPGHGLSVAVLISAHNFFPVLADQIAEIVDPVNPPAHAQISDNDPALSKRLENYAANLGVNGPDRALMSPEAASRLSSLLAMLRPTVAIFGTPKSWRLIARSAEGDASRSCSYLASYQFGELIWTFGLTPDDKIESVFATPD